MRRQGGGFGFVVLLMVLAVVFYLAMNNFKSVAPEAMQIKRHNERRTVGSEQLPVEDGTQSASKSSNADAWNPSPPSKPNLSTMDQNTTQHTEAVSDALSQSN
jgi:hypothetical protein